MQMPLILMSRQTVDESGALSCNDNKRGITGCNRAFAMLERKTAERTFGIDAVTYGKNFGLANMLQKNQYGK